MLHSRFWGDWPQLVEVEPVHQGHQFQYLAVLLSGQVAEQLISPVGGTKAQVAPVCPAHELAAAAGAAVESPGLASSGWGQQVHFHMLPVHQARCFCIEVDKAIAVNSKGSGHLQKVGGLVRLEAFLQKEGFDTLPLG
jgi:hypothetical protein